MPGVRCHSASRDPASRPTIPGSGTGSLRLRPQIVAGAVEAEGNSASPPPSPSVARQASNIRRFFARKEEKKIQACIQPEGDEHFGEEDEHFGEYSE